MKAAAIFIYLLRHLTDSSLKHYYLGIHFTTKNHQRIQSAINQLINQSIIHSIGRHQQKQQQQHQPWPLTYKLYIYNTINPSPKHLPPHIYNKHIPKTETPPGQFLNTVVVLPLAVTVLVIAEQILVVIFAVVFAVTVTVLILETVTVSVIVSV